MMENFDVIVIGAGPAGIAATIRLASYSRSVLLVESGRPYTKRYCPADHLSSCKGCGGVCNVISGFGGSIHYGDSVKLSLFPSGKRLSSLLGSSAITLQEAAMDILTENEWPKFTHNIDIESPFDIKQYPVASLSNHNVEKMIERLNDKLTNYKNVKILYNTEADNIYQVDNSWQVELISSTVESKRQLVTAEKVIVAVGRRGIQWWRHQIRRLNLKYNPPTISVGVRFECHSGLLSSGASIHPDFKTTILHNGIKVKTFCFCAGSGGGKIKFTDYGDYTLLDGHVIAEESNNELGNFALLVQLRAPDGTPYSYEWVQENLIEPYKRLRIDRSGKPVIQWYPDFKADQIVCTSLEQFKNLTGFFPSMKDYGVAQLSALFPQDILTAICAVFEQLMDFFIPSGFDFEQHGNQVGVIGLELESMWDELIVTPEMETSLEGLYACGDCAGIAQGITQAAVAGLAAASDIVAGVNKKKLRIQSKNNYWLIKAVELAKSIFADNLQVAFIGGSYANGSANSSSDIDLFVILYSPNPSQESIFAEKFHQLHIEAGLKFDHCGEILDSVTLAELLDFTDACLQKFPGIQYSACYQADCILSIFRKGDVIYKFLHDSKLLPVGNVNLLSQLEERAEEYFNMYPLPRIQHQKRNLKVVPGSDHAILLESYSNTELFDIINTPVGVDLQRWFGKALSYRKYDLLSKVTTLNSPSTSRTCPMDLLNENLEVVSFAKCQCLAIDFHKR